MNFWNILKYYLGMKCVAKFGENYVVTKREALFLRVCLCREKEYWWTHGFWNRHCSYGTLEEAEARLGKVTTTLKPVSLKLTPTPGK